MSEPATGQLVRALSVTYPSGFCIGDHQHPWAQLLFARSGVMEVECGRDLWTVPPTRAVWIPAGRPHQVTMRGAVAVRTLYLEPDQALLVHRRLGVVEVVPLLGELIAYVARIGMLEAAVAKHQRLAGLLTDLIGEAKELDLRLPLPDDPRARRLAERLLAEPGSKARLVDVASNCGAGLRTLERLFLDELGVSIGTWRQKARLIHASAALAEGASVTQAALDCGYGSVSAFIAAFRKQFGATPGRGLRRA
jgi:AraC-like DNA-binding protein